MKIRRFTCGLLVSWLLVCAGGLPAWSQDPPQEENGPVEPGAEPTAEPAPPAAETPPETAPPPDAGAAATPTPPDGVVPGAEPPPPESEPPPEAAPEPPPAPPPVQLPRPSPFKVAPSRPSSRSAGRGAPAGPAPQPVCKEDEPMAKEGKTASEPISFDYTDIPLTEVVTGIARMTGKNFDVDPSIASTRVTIITHDKIPPEMAYEVLESILNSRGFSLVPTLAGQLIKIVPIGESLEKIKIRKGEEGVPTTFDELSTHIVKIEYADSGELAGILQQIGSKTARVDAYQKTNTLIITDTADGLRRIFTLLEEVDVPGFDTEMEIFRLEYSRADVLAGQIQEVLTGTGTASSGTPPSSSTVRRPPTPTRAPVRPSVPGQSQPTIIGNREETLRIVPDERLNTIIVIATSSLLERVRDLVAKLDTPTPYESNNMNVYKLLNADAEQVEKALNAIMGSTPRAASDKAPGQSGEVQPFEKKVMITRYEQNNALLVLASPQDYKLIKEIIAQLDVPQRQVLVEAVILDVSIQDTFGLSVDAASVTGNDGFVMGSTSNIQSIINTADLATAISTGSPSLSMANALLTLGSSGGLSAGMKDTIETRISGVKVKIPFVPLMVKALETLTDVDILSQPSLTSQDNEPADIVVGQEVPVPTMRSGYSYDPRYSNNNSNTSSQTSTSGMSSYGSGISRQDVGVKMKVTPHINEGDYVSLETEVEVSEATPSNVGINSNELGPTFNKSKITNNVVVKDGTTGVIGGLIKETTNRTRSLTPILGDLPVLGWLFRSNSNTRKKQNVVVLITPYIIKEGVDMDRVSDHKMAEFRDANVDALFEKGIIKRVKKSYLMRKNYRPSINRSEEMLDKDVFGRGDIQR